MPAFDKFHIHCLVSLAKSIKKEEGKSLNTEIILNQTDHLMFPNSSFINRLHVDYFPWHITWSNMKGFSLYADISNNGEHYLMTILDGSGEPRPRIWLNRECLQGHQVKTFLNYYIHNEYNKLIYTKNGNTFIELDPNKSKQVMISALDINQINFLHCVGDPKLLINRKSLIIR